MDQAAVHEQIELVTSYRDQGQRLDGLIKVRKQAPCESQRVVLETGCDSVMNDEVHVELMVTATSKLEISTG